jgi:hypothetical protein
MTVLPPLKQMQFPRIAGLILLIALGGCGSGNGRDISDTPISAGDSRSGNLTEEDDGGFLFFGGGGNEAVGIGVNNFLWRATLDTLSFMPLQSADPFGGVIISDWYEDPQSPGERFKIMVYILDQRLRADGIRVAVFRQENQGSKGWRDVPVETSTALDLENAVLTRARQLRIDSIQD